MSIRVVLWEKLKKAIKIDLRWHMPGTPATGRLRQEDPEFKASMGYIVSLKPT
jgi:hypothetical protein